MSKLKYKVTEFNIVGQLIGFIIKDGVKIKYLRLTVSGLEYWVKMPKEMRNTLDQAIQPGRWLAISGMRQLCLKTGKIKFVADEINLLPDSTCENPENLQQPSPKTQKPKASILVCKKSSCAKRGGLEIYKAIQENLEAHGLENDVKVKLVGCVKECKKGPNVIVMPDKARYQRIHSEEVPKLIDKHFKTEKPMSV